MARIGRLAGALLVESRGDYSLVGELKEPCDFAATGFQSPGPIPPLHERGQNRFISLKPLPPEPSDEASDRERELLRPPWLEMALEGEQLLQLLSQRLLIQRNGSVSERLWHLICGAVEQPSQVSRWESRSEGQQRIDGRWLEEMPAHIWEIVRDQVLRCL